MNTQTKQSKTHFILRKAPAARKLMKLTAIFMPPTYIALFMVLHYLGLPREEMMMLALISIVLCFAFFPLAIHFSRFRVEVQHTQIHYRSLFSEKHFSFQEIKRAVTAKGVVKLYSAEGKPLLSFGLNDENADLFMDIILERGIETR